MALYNIEYDYVVPEYGTLELELDDSLTKDEREEQALRLIKDLYPDVEEIEITEMKAIN